MILEGNVRKTIFLIIFDKKKQWTLPLKNQNVKMNQSEKYWSKVYQYIYFSLRYSPVSDTESTEFSQNEEHCPQM